MSESPAVSGTLARSGGSVTEIVPLPPLTRRRAADLFTDDTGAATAEYAIATMATVAGLERIRKGPLDRNEGALGETGAR